MRLVRIIKTRPGVDLVHETLPPREQELLQVSVDAILDDHVELPYETTFTSWDLVESFSRFEVLTEVLGARAEEVDDVEVLAEHEHDLDLGHEGEEVGLGHGRLGHLDGDDRARLELVDAVGRGLEDHAERAGPDLFQEFLQFFMTFFSFF